MHVNGELLHALHDGPELIEFEDSVIAFRALLCGPPRCLGHFPHRERRYHSVLQTCHDGMQEHALLFGMGCQRTYSVRGNVPSLPDCPLTGRATCWSWPN